MNLIWKVDWPLKEMVYGRKETIEENVVRVGQRVEGLEIEPMQRPVQLGTWRHPSAQALHADWAERQNV
jgi:hypothetical protein